MEVFVLIDINQVYIVNYCHKNCEPLKNIMRLPEKEAFTLAEELASANAGATAFGRFADFDKYYPERLETDRILYERFINMGGVPKTEHPLSFVLQECEFLHRWFDNGAIIKIPISRIPSDSISFTYGDSMTTLRRNGKIEMITKEALGKLMEEYSGTLEEFLQEIHAKYNYIEVQLWDDQYAKMDKCIL